MSTVVKSEDGVENAAIANYWKPKLCVVGADGLPNTGCAGNLLRAETTVKLSIRTPPTLEPVGAANKLKEVLEKDPPYGASVKFDILCACAGWCGMGFS